MQHASLSETIDWQCWAGEFEKIQNNVQREVARKLDCEMQRWLTSKGPPPDPAMIVEALRSSGTRLPIAGCIAVRLIAPSCQNPAAYVMSMFHSGTAASRGWMMRFLDSHFAPVYKQVVEAGLNDRSARVREWACEGVDNGEFRDLAPKLRELARTDPAAKVREAAANTADMLELGYQKDWDESQQALYIRLRRDGGFLTIRVSKAVVDRLGQDSVIAIAKVRPHDHRLRDSGDTPGVES